VFTAALAGLSLAIAIAGRQTLLVVLFAAPVLLISAPPGRLLRLLGFAFLPVMTTGGLIAVWGGLTPPKTAYVAGISLGNGVTSFAYAGVFMFLLAPPWFRLSRRILAAAAAGGVLLAVLASPVSITPARSVAYALLPERGVQVYSFVCSTVLTVVSVLFVVSLGARAWERRRDSRFLFLALAVAMLAAAPLAIAHTYSSRYTASALPLLVLLASPFIRADWLKVAVTVVGATLGCVTLASYLRLIG
jgi:hypothetical protein